MNVQCYNLVRKRRKGIRLRFRNRTGGSPAVWLGGLNCNASCSNLMDVANDTYAEDIGEFARAKFS